MITKADAEQRALRFWERKWPQVVTTVNPARCEDLVTAWIIGCNHSIPPGCPATIPGMISYRPPATRRLLVDRASGNVVELAATAEQEACEIESYRRTGRIRERLPNRIVFWWNWRIAWERRTEQDESFLDSTMDESLAVARATLDEWRLPLLAGIRQYTDCPEPEIDAKIAALGEGRFIVLVAPTRQDRERFWELLQRIPGVILYR